MGKAANLYKDGGYTLNGSSYVVEKYLGNTWLWDKVGRGGRGVLEGRAEEEERGRGRGKGSRGGGNKGGNGQQGEGEG